MKKLNKNIPLITMVMLVITLGFFISCNDDDAAIANGQVQLLSFGPSGNMHGETISFIGNNLDQVTSIKLPGVEVTSENFTSQTAERIELVIPQETVEGKVTLVSPQGEVTSKTVLSFEVPFTVTNITSGLRPGENLVITGQFLNWVESVVFTDGVEVLTFESASLNQLVVKVPFQAQTGAIVLIGKGTKTYTFESEQDIVITLPEVTNVAPQALKHGDLVTITGTDLDLVESIVFPNNIEVAGLQSQSATKIEVKVPNGAVNGTIKLKAYSGVLVNVEQAITIILPVITSAMPTPVEIGANLTITGTNLDLVKDVIIPGAPTPIASFVSQTATEIVLTVPIGSFNGAIKLNTINDFFVASEVKIEIAGLTNIPLGQAIFDDSLHYNFGNWGWGVQTNINYTDNVYEGTTAIRKDWTKPDGGGGGIQFGGGNMPTAGMTELVMVIYGGEGLLDGGKHKIVVDSMWDDGIYIIVPEGKWTEFTIPLTDLPLKDASKLTELVIEGKGSYSLIDKIGMR